MDLQPLLVALMSEDNEVRQQAEKSLNDEWLQNASDQLLIQLVTQTRFADSETVRSSVAMLTVDPLVCRCSSAAGRLQDL